MNYGYYVTNISNSYHHSLRRSVQLPGCYTQMRRSLPRAKAKGRPLLLSVILSAFRKYGDAINFFRLLRPSLIKVEEAFKFRPRNDERRNDY